MLHCEFCKRLSYLTYLRDRLTVARDLLTESGSVFVQIGDENVHRVRALMDEVFGEENFISQVSFVTTSAHSALHLSNTVDFLLMFAKKKDSLKYRHLYGLKLIGSDKSDKYTNLLMSDGSQRPLTSKERTGDSQIPDGARIYTLGDLVSRGWSEVGSAAINSEGRRYECPSNSHWKTNHSGLLRLGYAGRLVGTGKRLMFRRFLEDFAAVPFNNQWMDTSSGFSLTDPKVYVVQTRSLVIERCILMATDPGDLVLDPTCGAGTSAYVAEQWGRRWITIDTSRVALALARARVMGARYPYYLLADSRDGQNKEGELSSKVPSEAPTYNDIRQSFVYERVPHITLKSIANNAEIDVIWEKHEERLAQLRDQLSVASGRTKTLEEWEIPREIPEDWTKAARPLHEAFWKARVARQRETDASIAAKADYEFLYDKPYENRKKVRVAGPFTVESLSPHRLLGVDEDDELIDEANDPVKRVAEAKLGYGETQDFPRMILDNLKTSGVQQAHKEDRISFSAIRPWPGDLVCAEGTYVEGNADSGPQRRAGVFIGPEFGTVSRPDLVQAAREAADADFDVLIACAFNYDAHASEFNKLGRIPILKARMNADLHMADDLKNTGKGNLFVIFGEPDIDILDAEDSQIQVKVNGVDVFHPNTGEIRSDNADGIACWFVDTDYNQESFFVRHAYFLGANDPYKALKTTLKAEINQQAWETLHGDTSRPFPKPTSGRIAVKVINHLGDEVMKVFRV